MGRIVCRTDESSPNNEQERFFFVQSVFSFEQNAKFYQKKILVNHKIFLLAKYYKSLLRGDYKITSELLN